MVTISPSPTAHPFEDEVLDFPTPTEPRLFYVLCSTPRCGSSFLARELWRTGVCGAPHEYFNFHSVMFRYSARLGTTSLHDYFRRIKALRTSPNGVFGLKAHLDQYRFLALVSGLAPQLRPVKHILIKREDIVQQAVSLAMARQTGCWFPGQTAKEMPQYDRRLISDAEEELRQADKDWESILSRAGIAPLEVGYQALCADPTSVIQRVVNFLEVDTGSAKPIEHLPAVDRQSDPLKDDWVARYRAET